jgi:phosphoribosyl-AMP cyclohydrolase / phosphoribosyl-ATP pyrophosphohydrolase
MNIIQDIYSKNILAISQDVFAVNTQTQWGEVVKIDPKGDFSVVSVKTNEHFVQSNDLAAFLNYLEKIVQDRKNNPTEKSYTSTLLARGINKVAQKVGEEAVELVIEAKDDNKELFLNESSDLLYHLVVLIVAKGYKLDEIIEVLKSRH